MAAVSATIVGAALGSVAARRTAPTQVWISIGGHSQCALRDSRTVRCRSPIFPSSDRRKEGRTYCSSRALTSSGLNVIESTANDKEVEFTWKGQGSEVLITGDFLNWETKLPLEKRTTGDFCLKQKLALGRYSYKFVVDGEWKHSPDCPTVPDGTGGFNNEVIVADPTTMNGVKDFENATKAQVLQPTNNVKAAATAKPAKETKRDVAVGNPKASTEPRPKAAPKKVVPQSLNETMSDNVIPLLRSALSKEAGISDLDVTFEDNQLKTSFTKGNIPYCHWVFFPDGILEGSRGSSITSHGAPPSTIEPFLVDEKKISPELLVFWIKKRLFAQKILSMN